MYSCLELSGGSDPKIFFPQLLLLFYHALCFYIFNNSCISGRLDICPFVFYCSFLQIFQNLNVKILFNDFLWWKATMKKRKKIKSVHSGGRGVPLMVRLTLNLFWHLFNTPTLVSDNHVISLWGLISTILGARGESIVRTPRLLFKISA